MKIDTDKLVQLEAVQDGPEGHYPIRPKDPSRLAGWIATRDSIPEKQDEWHPLTRELYEAVETTDLQGQL